MILKFLLCPYPTTKYWKYQKGKKITDDMTLAHLWGGANFRNSLLLLYFTSSSETNWTKAQKNMNNAMISFENKQYAVAIPLLLSIQQNCRCGQIFEKFANIKRHIEICRKGSGCWTAAALLFGPINAKDRQNTRIWSVKNLTRH